MGSSPQGQGHTQAPDDRLRILLTEYEKAQDSAEHHDKLIWDATSILWVASGVLFYTVVQGLAVQTIRKPLLTALILVALGLTVFVWAAALLWSSVKNDKYKRCKEIEALIRQQFQVEMRNHSAVEYPPCRQKTLYAILTVYLLGVWIFALYTVWTV